MVVCGLLLGCLSSAIAAADEPAWEKLSCLEAAVEVTFDGYGIPHIYAESWSDAYRVLAVLHVRERLAQMEFTRRVASGTLAEIIGPPGLSGDKLVRQLGIRSSCDEIARSPMVPDAMRRDLSAYCEGANSAIQAANRAGLPPLVQALGVEPAAWEPVDCLVFLKYMGWDQSGTSDDLWFGQVAEALGPAATAELWPLERPYEIPTVQRQFDRKTGAWTQFEQLTPSELFVDMELRSEPARRAFERTRATIDAARVLPRGSSFGSNNWVVDGTKTKSGKPMLCSDPHLGFRLPAIWYACHLSVGDRNVVGVTFPGSPIIIIGHNDQLGWGITNMQADAVDYFVETTDDAHPEMYRHRGEWKPFEKRTETINVRNADAIEFTIESTVHGPVIERDEAVITMQWTGLGPTTDPIGLWKLNRATHLEEFFEALDLVEVPALNINYADVDGNIAIYPMGRLPIRPRGAGRVPMEGASGTHDWAGWIPRDELPLAVNPPEHFVASANGRPHPVGYPHYLGWTWDDSYRIRRINAMLSNAKDLTIASMSEIQNDATDLAAERFLPMLVAAVEDHLPADPFARAMLQQLKDWDYVADGDSTATFAWLRWLEHFRQATWDDEWESRGLEKKGGSWGFNGNNGREPMLEVLEYMVREMPRSPWFDDQRTPAVEAFADIARRSFQLMMDELRKQPGTDLSAYPWKRFNVVRIGSLFGEPSLGRTGGPVPGDSFTVNPGGDGGTVGGGACWRMIIDFADVAGSVGVYPGGQSGDPENPHYADLLPIWEKGAYVPLHMVRSKEDLPADAKQSTARFEP